ncbi:MAG TPA: hypothetical protein VGB91_04020 [Rhizomicrobium sp.]
MSGYTPTELDDIQAKWDLRFPPDLVVLYRERRRVVADEKYGSLDWTDTPDEKIRDALGWPLEGFLFDIRQGLWWPEWGDMPAGLDLRAEKLRAIFAEAPKLIPVCGHRYIPDTPHESGNPIFSVWQMDVIHYGANLDHYAGRENRVTLNADSEWPPLKPIPFWSRAVAFNNERFADGGGFAFLNRDGVLPGGT